MQEEEEVQHASQQAVGEGVPQSLGCAGLFLWESPVQQLGFLEVVADPSLIVGLTSGVPCLKDNTQKV